MATRPVLEKLLLSKVEIVYAPAVKTLYLEANSKEVYVPETIIVTVSRPYPQVKT